MCIGAIKVFLAFLADNVPIGTLSVGNINFCAYISCKHR